MKKYLSLLKNSKLFQGISENELLSMLNCLSAVTRSYQKGEYVFTRGERIDSVALLLEGCIHIQKEEGRTHRQCGAAVRRLHPHSERGLLGESEYPQRDLGGRDIW